MSKRIPITAAKRIAEEYGWDQVIIYARDQTGPEHVTTYGVTKKLCTAAAKIGDILKDLMGWHGVNAPRAAAVVEYVQNSPEGPVATRIAIKDLPDWAQELYL